MHTAVGQHESIRVYSTNLSCYLCSIKYNILVITEQRTYVSFCSDIKKDGFSKVSKNLTI